MTLDELLQQLMKIKEVYPDSGKYTIVADLKEQDYDVPIYKCRIVGNQIVLEDEVK